MQGCSHHEPGSLGLCPQNEVGPQVWHTVWELTLRGLCKHPGEWTKTKQTPPMAERLKDLPAKIVQGSSLIMSFFPIRHWVPFENILQCKLLSSWAPNSHSFLLIREHFVIFKSLFLVAYHLAWLLERIKKWMISHVLGNLRVLMNVSSCCSEEERVMHWVLFLMQILNKYKSAKLNISFSHPHRSH